MNTPKVGTSFSEFCELYESKLSHNKGLHEVVDKIISASLKISREVNHAGLGNILGKAHKENVQGEEVMKLDELANDLLIEELQSTHYCAGVASEELEDFTPFSQSTDDESQYVVLFDPLDGSSNIDTNAPIGTIFSIYRRTSKGELLLSDFLQKGTDVLLAGYVIYGSSTMLVYSMGEKVHGFTLDMDKNEYCLSHFDIKTPKTANQFSVNYGNYKSFGKNVNDFMEWCSQEDKSTKRPFSIRYIGSMVADFHRNLLKGGIFIYPASSNSPKGKLRLMYECIPLSFIQEHADGASTNDFHSILNIIPTELHERTPVALGSADLVNKYLSFKN